MKKGLACLLALTLLLTSASSAMAIGIEFWHAGASVVGTTIDEEIAAFNSTVGLEKGIEVTGVFQGTYDETLAKTMNAIAAGNQPALVMLEHTTGVPTMASNDALVYLDDYAKASNLDLTDFVDILMKHSYDNEGHMIALPYMRSCAVYYYNKTLFDELKLQAPKTIDELVTVGRAVHQAKPDIYGFEMYCMSGGQWILVNMLAQLGSNCFSPDGLSCPALEDGTMLTVLKAWKSWVEEGWCSIPAITNTGSVLRENFVQGRIASMCYSCGSMSGILSAVAESEKPFEVGVAYIPTFGIPNPPIGGNNVGIVKPGNSQEVLDAAWEFLMFLEQPAQAALSSKNTGYVPATKAAA
ncbi:MAG: extracellular solute-binding protein, partial [Clostridia bacterium]